MQVIPSTPLSYSQQALWFIYRDAPQSAAYNMALPLRFTGDVDVQTLRQALQRLVERHSMLRSRFSELDGVPYRHVATGIDGYWQDVDAEGWTEVTLREALYRQSLQPFALEHSVFRATLFQGSGTGDVLLLNLHHIAGDAASLAVLGKELLAFYGVENVPPTATDYADYVHWEAELLNGPKGQRMAAYWQQQLAGDVPVLQLPTDYPRPARQTFNGASVRVELPEPLTEAVKNLAKAHKTTLFTVLFSAYQVLLQRYSGQDDIWIGIPTSTPRNQAEFADMVGYLVNPMIMRGDFANANNVSFSQLLQRNGKHMLTGLYHQPYPFTQLIEQLQPHRNPAYPPLVQAMFALERDDLIPKHFSANGVQARSLAIAQMEGQLDLALTFSDSDDGKTLSALWDYNRDLFNEVTIARMAEHLHVLLQGAVDDAEQDIAKMPLLTDYEQAQLKQWTSTETDYPKDQTVVDLFERQASTKPDNIAAIFAEQSLSYCQLNDKANRLAHYLLDLKTETGVPLLAANPLIAIAVERSLDMVAGLLAILKIGGAYLPIDPDYPSARILDMLDDSATPLLLTTSNAQTRLPLAGGKQDYIVLCLDELDVTGQRTDNPAGRVGPEDLAYVIYTSGSTGKPKGVMIGHQALTLHSQAMLQHYGLTENDRILQFASLSFDTSLEQLLVAWLSGACSVLLTSNLMPAQDLLALIKKHAVTVADLPPAYWQQMLDIATLADDWVSLRMLILGGEALPHSLAQQTRDRFPALTCFNAYGPTEATITPCIYRLPPTLTGNTNYVAIGKPRANTPVYILNGQHQPQPLGIPGELCIAGAGLARGYLHRPELTAEKFVDVELFGKSERIYKTGDLARWLSDGNLEFLGRIDQQIKLRGFRIELGEIEAALCEYPGVKEAVANLYEADGDKRIVAYLTTDNAGFNTDELRGSLKDRLPDYMVPSHFIVLDVLPLTPNGKIDRKGLPAPEFQAASGFSQPVTPSEDLLAALWAGVLKREAIGRHDNFFERGGHSLLATQLIARIRESFQVELPIRTVFEHPQLSELAAAIDAAAGGIRLPAIEPQASDEVKVLSFSQQRLWFLNQFEENNSATYNMPLALRLSGRLDVDALQQSLHWLVERHTGLRSHFPTLAGQAQVDIRDIEALQIQDLRLLPAGDREREAARLTDSHAVAPFDLEQGPLFRADLLLLDDAGAVLLLNMHHIVSDGWSMAVFMRDWQHAYTAFAEGGQPSLPVLPIQYSDYAAWQRQWLQGDVLHRQIDYWTGQLNGLPELLELPTDKLRPPRQSYRGAHVAHSLPSTLSQAVTRLSRQQGVTDFMTLLAAFEVLLSRYSRQQDVCVGSPIANRTHARTEDVIGFFVNTLVLRGQIDPRQSFAALLQATRQTCLDAYAHQDIPFEMLVEKLQPTRSLSHSPLFQVMFVLQNNEAAELALPNLEVSVLEADYPIAKFDLTLNVAEQDGQLQCYWEYATDLFTGDTVKRMAEHFEVLLHAVVANPEQAIGQLPLLTEQDILQLQAWNDTATDYPKDQTIVSLFERQATTTPDNIAVVFDGQSLSYRQLNDKANQLAYNLLDLKTKAGAPLLTGNPLIAIAVERSLDMIVGLLAILKAGGAYLPIDPDYPAVRIRHMLEDSQAPLLLTQSRLQGQLSPAELEHNCTLLCIDELELTGRSTENLPLKPGPEDLAYVIYTSGSTGVPKGVCIAHTAVVRLVKNTNYIQIGMDDCLAQASNVSFDAATFEIWGSLLNGARLVGVAKELLLSPQQLTEHLQSQRINTLFVTTALFNQIAQTQPGCFKSLKYLFFGGEQVDPYSVNTILRGHAPEQLLHVYGPTETTTFASWYRVNNGQKTDNTIPIGKPLANTEIFILNPQHRPQPPNVPGELCIAGTGLARGYLNQPELTAEKFVNVELFGKSERIYKTGDLARWLPDGNLEFLGRIDNQVKIRGFRIELGEIEAVLCQHPGVNEAVANLHEADGDKRIVAYLTSAQDHFSPDDLRGWLKDRLPDYMVPSHFMVLDSLPLTPNGKIDRKALPKPDLTIQGEQQLPHSATEQLLCSLWSQVLRFDVASVSANFFAVGGHSLLATQLVSRIRESFDIDMPLRTVFAYPSLREQAEWLDRQQRGSELPVILPLAEGEAPALSFAQQRLRFLAQLEGQSATYNMPAAFRLEGRLNEEALQRTLTDLIQRHETLRSCFPMIDGKPSVQLNKAYNPLSVTDLSGLADAEQQGQIAEWVDRHANAPFDLSSGPLFKAQLLRLGGEDHILLFNMHHIVSDGWSTGVMIRDWCRLYEAAVQNREPQLDELTIQYSDYAAWQRNWLQGAVLEQQLDYWTNKLAGAPELLELPTDNPRPAVMSYRGKHLQSTLNPILTQSIKQLSRKQGVTDFMTLLSAFTVLLFRYSGQTDIVVGCPIANRTQSQTEHLIGFFVNTLALRMQIDADQAFSDLLNQVRKTALEAYSHQDIPFEALVEKINPSRSLSHSPLFQVMFVLQNAPEAALELSDLQITPVESEHATAKFDLTLSVEEQGGTLVCNWEYNTDLFRQETIALMSEHFQVLLEGIVSGPEQSLAGLPLLTAAEQQRLQAWNRSESDYCQDLSIVDLFQAQAEKTPDNIAVVFESRQLTYRQLNQQANQLAHYLLDFKTGNGLVGICVERSLEMIVGLLAILKAGAAYVPLDPDYPEQRLQFILEDSAVPVLLTQSHLLERVPASTAKVVCIDKEWDLIADRPVDNPARQSGPGDLAYVIYTSGSTGKPKGCQLTQANVTRLFSATDHWYRFSEQDVWTLFHSYAFDFSVWEIWGALFYGGKLVIVPYHTSRNPALFYQLLIDQGVTVLNQTPSAFKQLQDVDKRPDELSLRFVIFGGEALDFAALQPWFARHGDSRPQLINMYGITETTVHVTYYPVAGGDNQGKSIIGIPIPDLQVWVVDAYNNPLPIGVPGEMLVGGAGVARGYLNRPELTAERFIDIELFGQRQRVYKSGDLARWLPDGNIEYLGRIDNQVKIRGFRIELGEIEACLAGIPAVKEAVVLASGEGEAKALAAYVTADSVLKVEELRASLNALLPAYMVPAYFVQLDALPLLPNGKINRKSLVGLKPIESLREFRPPQNALESELLSIWQNHLETDDISTNANFFEIGGNSLSLVRVHWEIEKQHPQTTLMDLFAHPNIADLALFLAGGEKTRIAIKTLTLDEKYFSAGNGGLFEYSLDDELSVRLNELGNSENLDIQHILRAAFAYLLFEISEQADVPYYAALNNRQVISVRHDFEAIDSLQELLQASRDAFLNPEEIYPVDDFLKTGANPGSSEVLAFYSNNGGDFDNADLDWQADTGNGTVNIAFKFSARMDREEMKGLPGLYVTILEEIIKTA
ncbi:non-ribosomal peptide synthetase [Candidatus Methylobacter oryzae]|uniref:Amino acid adenylation domain-containing protein n=1 Tax=Candidatus Methylobacter oryzae TaxID=2497749 RepID=A0ABY3C6A7_9GAMM|nr:non-ribosomal peptide synthetase [Candidatus Methylobacter oryzae]TRW90814.1 amino acid adenylation domain-containing protein [Candidatus Methylobacter oryzae]